MIISTDAEKAFDKHPFKTKSQTRHKRKLPQHNKVHISKAHSQYYTQWCKTENLPSNIRNKGRMHTLTVSFQHSTGNPSQSIQARKTNEGIQIGKEETKLSLFTDDMNMQETIKIPQKKC